MQKKLLPTILLPLLLLLLLLQLGFSSPSRVLRLASKSIARDEESSDKNNGSSSNSENVVKISRVLHSSCKKSTALNLSGGDLGADSGNSKTKKKKKKKKSKKDMGLDSGDEAEDNESLDFSSGSGISSGRIEAVDVDSVGIEEESEMNYPITDRKEEKGKGKLVENRVLSIGVNKDEDKSFVDEDKVDLTRLNETFKQKNAIIEAKFKPLDRKHRKNKNQIIRCIPKEVKDDGLSPVLNIGTVDKDQLDPLSVALRIIVERAAPARAPLQDRDFGSFRPLIPSLQDMCLRILCKNAEAITSLEGVPDFLRSKLSHWLCDSRRMDLRILGLIVSGSPSEIRLKDCSWMREDQLQEILKQTDTKILRELQLDQSGSCMTDYILRDTLARSANSFSALDTLSLRGAYHLSDDGLNILVSSAPSLRSINLVQCSLLTSTGITNLAEKLVSVLQELYMDDCQNVDAMLILPALRKVEHLNVLSVARIGNVCDEFVSELIPVCGPNIKKLVFSDCGKLTDTSLKVIGENCSGLCFIDLVNLENLTDLGLQDLSNGCRSLQVLKLCRNEFSDEGIAAFLEASGQSLVELSLNKMKKVANNTAIALASRCSKNLSILDLSWCRKLMDEALGLIVDKCFSLRLLKLFGCSQVTNKFLDGHSNPFLKIIGFKTTPLLEYLHMESALPY